MTRPSYLLQALKFVWKSSKKWTILLLIIQVLQAILPLCTLYLIKLIVDSLTTQTDTLDFNTIIQYISIFGAIHLLQAIVKNYQQLVSETQQHLVTDYMATIIIDKAIDVDISYYENAQYHDTFHQVQAQAVHRPIQILQNLSDLLRNALLLASLAGLLVFLHWGIALVLIAFGLPLTVVKWYYSKKLFDWERHRISLEREAYYLNEILTEDTYAKEVRIFNLGAPIKKQFVRVRKALFTEKYRINSQRARSGVLAQSTEILAMSVTYGFIAWRTFQGLITIGDLVMYFQAFQRGQSAIQQSLTSVVSLYNNRLFLSHLFELLHVESLLKKPNNPTPLPAKIQEGITLENVAFKYPGTTKNVLKDINITFKKNQVVALVGENGSGKTSLVKLLCRLYDPEKGTIYWNGTSIKEFALKDLRQKISVIYQDFAKYHFSASDNIRIGNYQQDIHEQTIKDAAHKSGADAFIEQLPNKFDQQLGRQFKDGAELSGGQWQKMALARAFYKEAEVIILDEPSSAIDPLAEAAIFEQFKILAKDKILILVTHRLYNLKMADSIVVLQEGSIVEQGTHEELVAMEGLYLKMFEKQVEKNE